MLNPFGIVFIRSFLSCKVTFFLKHDTNVYVYAQLKLNTFDTRIERKKERGEKKLALCDGTLFYLMYWSHVLVIVLLYHLVLYICFTQLSRWWGLMILSQEVWEGGSNL